MRVIERKYFQNGQSIEVEHLFEATDFIATDI